MLRPATPDDIPQLCEIEIATQIAPWAAETFDKCFQAESQGWVITQSEDKIIGFILVLLQMGECHILNLCIDPNQQHQGYGTKLLLAALTDAKQQGAVIAYLEVRRSNANAIALYQKMGFSKVGERKNYYLTKEGSEDACVFAREL